MGPRCVACARGGGVGDMSAGAGGLTRYLDTYMIQLDDKFIREVRGSLIFERYLGGRVGGLD